MYDVALYGHLTIDRIIDSNTSSTSLGSIANVWKALTTINPQLDIYINATHIGEALILVDKDSSRRYSKPNLNMKVYDTDIKEAKVNHVLYINELTDLNFISALDGAITADICNGAKFTDYEVLNDIDILFMSDDDGYDPLELSKYIRGYIVCHNDHGSTLYNSNSELINTHKITSYLDNINVLGAGDIFASFIINEIANDLTKLRNIKNLVCQSHDKTTGMLANEKI